MKTIVFSIEQEDGGVVSQEFEVVRATLIVQGASVFEAAIGPSDIEDMCDLVFASLGTSAERDEHGEAFKPTTAELFMGELGPFAKDATELRVAYHGVVDGDVVEGPILRFSADEMRTFWRRSEAAITARRAQQESSSREAKVMDVIVEALRLVNGESSELNRTFHEWLAIDDREGHAWMKFQMAEAA